MSRKLRDRLGVTGLLVFASVFFAAFASSDDTHQPPNSAGPHRHVWISNQPCATQYSDGPCFWDPYTHHDPGHAFWVSYDQCVYYLDPTLGDYCPSPGEGPGLR